MINLGTTEEEELSIQFDEDDKKHLEMSTSQSKDSSAGPNSAPPSPEVK
jgi:hypothetical protein